MTDRQLLIPFLMPPEHCDSICNVISHVRLTKYLLAAGFNNSRALDLYRWNAYVGECLHFPLQITEIAVRNRAHAALTAQYDINWHLDKKFLAILAPESGADINTATRRLKNRLDAFVSDDLVAALSLGFWVTILEPRYFKDIWRHHLKATFPHLPAGRAYKSIHTRAREILSLRNRVAHHEPLIGRDLSKEHANIIEFVSWICPHTAEWIKRHSYVDNALRQRP
jgi:hypothetical protein